MNNIQVIEKNLNHYKFMAIHKLHNLLEEEINLLEQEIIHLEVIKIEIGKILNNHLFHNKKIQFLNLLLKNL